MRDVGGGVQRCRVVSKSNATVNTVKTKICELISYNYLIVIFLFKIQQCIAITI